MLVFTEKAKQKLQQIYQGSDSSTMGLRLTLHEAHRVDIQLLDLSKLTPEEQPLRDSSTGFFVELESFLILVNAEGQKSFRDGELDYIDGGLLDGYFELKARTVAPGLAPLDAQNPIVHQVQDLLESEINPGLAMHGGRAELLSVQEDLVYLKFGGGCQGCSQIDMTVKQGIETRLKQAFPQIRGVVDYTDHAAGKNPYA